MPVMTSQYEISGKNQICSVKTFYSRGTIWSVIYSSDEKKNSLDQAAFWHDLKAVCCLQTPFLY